MSISFACMSEVQKRSCNGVFTIFVCKSILKQYYGFSKLKNLLNDAIVEELFPVLIYS